MPKDKETLNAKRQRNKGNQKGIYGGRPESTKLDQQRKSNKRDQNNTKI